MGNNEELVKLYQEGDKHAMDKLLEDNRGIITKLVMKYIRVNKRLEFDELFNSGVIGFMYAAKKYDFNNDKKASFTTYAIHYINRYIYSCVNGHSSTDIENNKFYNATISLNTSVGEREDIELIESIQVIDYSYENVEYKLYLQKLRQELEGAMKDNLTLKQREVLQFRYGWNTAPMTLQEIGDILGMNREKVRQIEIKTLRHLRNSKWSKTDGREFAKELMGVVSTSYKGVENKIDFIDRYFKNVV